MISVVFAVQARHPDCKTGQDEDRSRSARTYFTARLSHKRPANITGGSVLESETPAGCGGLLRRPLQFAAGKCESGIDRWRSRYDRRPLRGSQAHHTLLSRPAGHSFAAGSTVRGERLRWRSRPTIKWLGRPCLRIEGGLRSLKMSKRHLQQALYGLAILTFAILVRFRSGFLARFSIEQVIACPCLPICSD